MASPPLETLGRYRLVRILGRGAMGVVYEAQDERLGRTVAIKTVLRSHLDNETTAQDYAARFVREAQAAARLSHPNIVTVYDFGEHDDLSYIVMEFVSGRELAELFRSGHRFTLPQALQIMAELLDALAYAHAQGVVHRDVKPANVLVDQAGHVKLADFGVARISSGGQDRTMPGTMVGTPSYMSPEQILGQPVGSRTDIFAAGVVLYQFVTGRQPFEGQGMFDVQRRILQDEPTPPSGVFAGLPPVLDGIVLRALAKQPEDRYETAAAFAQDLRRLAADYLPAPGLPATAAPADQTGSTAVDLQLDIPSPPAVASPAPQSWVSPQTADQPAPAAAAPRRALWPYGLALGLIVAAAAWWWLQSPTAPRSGATVPPPAVSEAASAAALPASQPTAPAASTTATPAPAIDAPAVAAPVAVEPQPVTVPARPAPPPKADRPPPKDPARPATTPPAGAMRCADILERMQLGEPLSAEQSSFFQSRCAR
ncbi:MAG: serine/threonine protein kinase [Rubrivivax sp.]|nr:serine/threonine protein kinase [Rubrivivax sp.]